MSVGTTSRTILITGAARGIGRGCAQAFAAAGDHVIVSDRCRDAGEALVAELRDGGSAADFAAMDITDAEAIEACFTTLDREFGGLDVLVCNAGTHIPGDLEHTSDAHWDRLHELNLKGCFRCARAAVPLLRKRGGGAIVTIASMTGVMGQRDGIAYSASKGGIIAMSKSMALDLASDGIRANCICPGNIDTPLMQEWIAAQDDPASVRHRVDAAQPIGRLGEPEEVGRAAVFLSREPFLTGVTLAVDGGATLGY